MAILLLGVGTFSATMGTKNQLLPHLLLFNDRIGPLVDSSGRSIPFAPLLRARTTLPYGIVCSSWTLYQPHALVWDYGYWGTRQEFGRQAGKLVNKLPNFQWERIIPPPFSNLGFPLFISCRLKKDLVMTLTSRLGDFTSVQLSELPHTLQSVD